ncbi:hypothetical protein CDL12_28476 [Handroanthus impetiginosus]|uniref:Uncharacterized protein n=1 Tax=Handroanthus impetiginosus TaxID=429701 RepID=A0A2G9G1F3_9LAMI|nr:hypothetical protein CDL12_28476 [Handroanthus impetiginosus]
MLVATKLLARKKFIDTGKQFNLIAALWIQFMVHEWVDHVEDFGHQKLRTSKDGKLKISGDGLIIVNEDGTVLSGEVRNAWAGLSALQALLKEYPKLEDQELYRRARLVTYGLLGKKIRDRFGHSGVTLLSGTVGSRKPVDHGVPYSLTEGFVSVYRMHPLLPYTLLLRNINGAPGPNKSPPLAKDLIGTKGSNNMLKIGFTKLMVSMGHQVCGALELWNYPMWLRNLISQNVDSTDRPNPIDLHSLESNFILYRDRERNVARYNDFRRALLLFPFSKWEDLTDDKEAELDILVGLTVEKKIKGFAISETAVIIFLPMATRRLEADRFFISDFNEEVYTKKGLESLKDVLNRHYPKMSSKWINSTSAFSVWDASPEPNNLIPLYLRLPN